MYYFVQVHIICTSIQLGCPGGSVGRATAMMQEVVGLNPTFLTKLHAFNAYKQPF